MVLFKWKGFVWCVCVCIIVIIVIQNGCLEFAERTESIPSCETLSKDHCPNQKFLVPCLNNNRMSDYHRRNRDRETKVIETQLNVYDCNAGSVH